jgi:NAD(P)-dependent dehydrogenase (short-subunit alcohol dehydrogenase family)
MAHTFNTRYDHLDVLINNAGAVLSDKRFVTEDGFEGTMALNVLAPLLLSELLLPQLKRTPDGRIINMSSGTHRMARPDMEDLNLENVPSGQARYGISKLFVIWNSQHLAAQLQQAGITNVTVNASHPGAVATNFGQDSDNGFFNNLVYKAAYRLAHILHLSTASGAVTNVYLASSDAVRGVTGKFFDNHKRQVKPGTRAYTPAKELTLWNYCMAQLRTWLDEN